MFSVAGGVVNDPSGSGWPVPWTLRPPSSTVTSFGMPLPCARRLDAPSVTRVPSGIGHGVVEHVEVVRSPRRETGCPFNETTTTGGIVVVKGIEATSGTL